jgi:hypothetical protein
MSSVLPIPSSPFTLPIPQTDDDRTVKFIASTELLRTWPDHTQLPESDGAIVENFQEHPQSILLSDSISPLMRERHPDRRYAIGQNSGIYWRLPEQPEPLYRGAVAPDWFYVPGVEPSPAGDFRRSYVLWRELVAPLIVLEFVSGDGSEERDRTPMSGKFWIYEQMVRPRYYGIFEADPGRVEMYQMKQKQFRAMKPNKRSRFTIAPLDIEIGIWHGLYMTMEMPWIRFWDDKGNLLLTGEERAEVERQRAKKEKRRAKQERERAEQERQRAEQEKQRAKQERERAEQEKQRAEREKQRADRLAERMRALGLDPENNK